MAEYPGHFPMEFGHVCSHGSVAARLHDGYRGSEGWALESGQVVGSGTTLHSTAPPGTVTYVLCMPLLQAGSVPRRQVLV